MNMKKYEVMYIIKESVEAEKRAELIETLSAIITNNGGKVVKTDEWGMRDFAYEIDDMTKGYYVVTSFEADNDAVKEFDRLMRINPSVVRFLVTRDEAPVQEAKK
jgi:small subunit ribosomal protein S6